jgi:hypothetical protein
LLSSINTNLTHQLKFSSLLVVVAVPTMPVVTVVADQVGLVDYYITELSLLKRLTVLLKH